MGQNHKEVPGFHVSHLKVQTIFSHLSGSGNKTLQNFTHQQLDLFNIAAAKIETVLGYATLKHIANSDAILLAPIFHLDMVRLGIGLYGFGNDKKETEKLKNVLTLKSVISQIHTIEKGETVGYNRAFKANSTIKTATIPIGHADGISRQFSSGNGYVYIKNKKAPIVGNVCMDMIMVNITDINCNEGDEVLVYKNQFHIEELAKSINTISYEILTAISQRVTRIVN